MTIYTKTMKEALESMYISEDNVAILRDIVKRKSIMTLKFADGKMKVDLFTASAVTQALDKVNPANKAKITKMINTGKKANFMSIAKVVMKSENNPEIEEEVEVKVEEVSLLAQQAAILISKRERERNPRKEEGLVTIVEGLSMIIKDPKTKKKMQLAANQKVQWNGSNYETDGVTKKQVLVMRDGRKEVVMTKQQIEDDLKNGSFKVTDLGNVYQPEELQIESFQLNEKIEGLVTKAEKSGMPYGILKKVYDRGMAAYKTGHRPGTTAQQWAFARVNSFVTKSSGTWGKADADLAKQVRGESVKEETPCWNGFKQVGMKTKGGKQVPNCVPEETTTEACCDDCDDLYDHVIAEAEYQGKKVQLNNPIRTSENPNKKFKVYTMGPSGKVVVVRFGDPNMGINRDDPKARAAFRSRHSCDEKKDKTTAGYWSCYQWRASSKVDN